MDMDTAYQKPTLSGMMMSVSHVQRIPGKPAEHASYEDHGRAHGFGTIFHMPDLGMMCWTLRSSTLATG